MKKQIELTEAAAANSWAFASAPFSATLMIQVSVSVLAWVARGFDGEDL